MLHVLRDCSQAKNLWLRVVPSKSQPIFFSHDLKEWILHNLENKLDIPCHGNWACFFGVATWRIWFFRNQFIFVGLRRQRDILDDINSRMMEIMSAKNALDVINTGTKKVEHWIA